MASTSTLKNIFDELVKQTGWGIVIPSFTGTTTTLTLTTTGSSELRGPFTGKKFAIGDPVVITAGGTPLEDTYVADWSPSTGVITVSPAITTGATDGIIITNGDIKHGDRLVDAVKRAIDNRVARWQRTPLTFVPDGDLRGATVTDYWTGTNATPTYVTPTFPAGSAAAAFGFGGIQRVLQSVATNATNRVTSNLINVALNSTVTAYQWYFQTAIRVVTNVGGTGSPTAQFAVWDETNNAQITANVIAGSDTFTHTTSSLGFLNIEGTANIPATCKQISFRLIGGMTTSFGTSVTIQMTPLIAYPVDALTFPLPNRIISEEYVGNFYNAWPTGGTTGQYALAFTEPITTGGHTHRLENFGDHLTVTFNFRPTRPVWYDEMASDPELTAITSTTAFPLEQVVRWTKFEMLNMLWEGEDQKYIPYGTRSIPEPSRWLQRRNAALKSAMNSEFEPDMVHVLGRV